MNPREEKSLFSKRDNLFYTAFSNASAGMALVGTNGKVLEVNEAALNIFGYTREELLNLTFKAITHPEDLATDQNFVRKLLCDEVKSFQMEKRYLHKNGEIIWAILSVSLVRDEAGKPLYFISQIQNITDRKSFEAKLKKREDEFKLILQNSSDAIARIDTNFKFLFMSNAIEHLTGFPVEYFVGRNLKETLVTIEIYEEWEKILLNIIATKKQTTIDFASRVLSGKHFLITLKPELDINGEVETILVNFRDITERRKTEIALESSEKELKTLLTNAPTVIVRFDRNCRVLYINPVIEYATGKPPSDYIGKRMIEAEISKDLSQKFERKIKQTFKSNSILEVEFDNLAGDGRYYFARFIPELDARGEVETVLVFSVDITERKENEMKVFALNEQLQNAIAQVKQLQGMLPICAYCKSIRDDQNYWQSVEEYITKRSDAHFSHGICPDCYDVHIKTQLKERENK